MVAETLSGLSLSDLDDRYLNANGDTVGAPFVVNGDGTNAFDVIVRDQASGNDTINMDGFQALIDLGVLGEDGNIVLRDDDTGNMSVRIDGSLGGMWLGGPSQDGYLFIRNTADADTITMNGESGDINYEGALIGAFPRPAYDSGFLTYADGGESKTLNHNIGGDPDDYVVDLQCKFAVDGLAHNWYIGREINDAGGVFGLAWDNLQSNSIDVIRFANDPFCDQARVRIWEIK